MIFSVFVFLHFSDDELFLAQKNVSVGKKYWLNDVVSGQKNCIVGSIIVIRFYVAID